MSVQVRTLLAGLLVALSTGVLALTGGALGIAEPWPVLLIVGAGLLVGVPRLRHAMALVSGVLIGTVTAWAALVLLPDAAVGRAVAATVGVLLITVVTSASRGRLRLGLQLVGWAAMTALAGTATSAAGAPRLGDLARAMVTLLVATGLGLLVAQVAQLVGTGVVGRRRDVAPLVLALAVGLAPLALAASPAGAEHAGPGQDHRVVEHRQTVVRTHTADGTVTGGRVVTRLSVGARDEAHDGAPRVTSNGPDDTVIIVLREQAVGDLRSLSTLAAGSALGVSGRTVTHTLTTDVSGAGVAARTVATLDRTIPIDVEVAMTLDGAPIAPAGIVGRSGRLGITYTLINRTVESRELRHFDGRGRPRTVTRDVAVPFVGELVVLLDDRFTGVDSPDAVVTAVPTRTGARPDVLELRSDVVLAEPIGRPVRSITWSADVVDAVVPAVSVRLIATPLAGTATGTVEDDRAERVARALRDVADASELVRTGLTALTPSGDGPGDGGVLAATSAALDAALAAAVTSGTDISELRALVAAQDRRAVEGDGLVHGLLDARDVSAAGATTVLTSSVHILELSGLDGDDAPDLLVRLALALLLLGAVGLLGRAIAALTVPDVT